MSLDAYQLERRFEPSCEVRAIALVLHGGTDDPEAAGKPVRRPWPTPWGNAFRVQQGIARRTRAQGIAVWALRHRLAGWDGDQDPTPAREARAALSEIRRIHPDRPVVLVGHSMGGRTAVRCADEPAVVGVVGLAPWLPREESASRLRGRHLRVAYARLDHLCGLSTMSDFLSAARDVAASVETRDMGNDVHYMLFETRWHDYASDQLLAMVT